MASTADRLRLAAASRDGHLALRRVERQQTLVERLAAAGGQPVTFTQLAREQRTSSRTIARDVERLVGSGVPLRVQRGRFGGVSLRRRTDLPAITFDVTEIAALISSLATLGPSVSPAATSAMGKLAAALVAADHPDELIR